MYGWRGRIGLLVPSVNTTMEREFSQLAPDGVSVHSARMDVGGHGTPEALREMGHIAKRAATDVAMAKPDVVVYGCTSGSFFEGPAFNERITSELRDIVKVPVVTTAGAMAASLLRARAKRINVVTPYVDLTNERLKQFLKAFGIDVVRLSTFDMLDLFDHAKIQPERVYRTVKEMDSDEAQAVFIACTQVRGLEVVALLERDLGKPVYSANQASIWQAYDELGVDPGITEYGSLLRSLSTPVTEGAFGHVAEDPLRVEQGRR
jgi:maleate cis-trans isomerase